MWDPEQLAEIPVILDRLVAAGDPLGEWLAIRDRLDARTDVTSDDRRQLRRRARWLRSQLGPRLVLADDAAVGPVHAIRERGLLIDVSASEANRARLAELLGRPDAALLLRLRLRGDVANLRECVAWLLDPSSTMPARVSLRELQLDCDPSPDVDPLDAAALASPLAARLDQLFSLRVDGRAIPLPFTPSPVAQPWTSARPRLLAGLLRRPD